MYAVDVVISEADLANGKDGQLFRMGVKVADEEFASANWQMPGDETALEAGKTVSLCANAADNVAFNATRQVLITSCLPHRIRRSQP